MTSPSTCLTNRHGIMVMIMGKVHGGIFSPIHHAFFFYLPDHSHDDREDDDNGNLVVDGV